MARSRKNVSAVRAGAAAKTGVIVLFIVASCVGYVWQKKQINSLSNAIRAGTARLKALQEDNDKMRPALASLMSPESLDRKVRDMRLGLAQPDLSHVWRLPEPSAAEEAGTPPKPLEFAAQRPARARTP